MVVLNEMSRYHLCLEVLHRLPQQAATTLEKVCRDGLARHHVYIREYFDDMPEIKNFAWPG
jgi:xylulose-5-phosphate/fructose-6-phosphate phosphoketolase